MKHLFLATSVVLLVACSNNSDLYDASTVEKEAKLVYSENFVKKYPNVTLNQSWDYSHKNPTYSLPASSRATTRAANYSFSVGAEYEVDKATLEWMNARLTERKDNRSLGAPFYMTVPGNSFTIVPIYQGHAASAYNLHVVVDGVDIKIWEKSQDIWVKQTIDGDWIPVYSLHDSDETARKTENAAAVKAKSYVFDGLPVGKDMYFYLEITKNWNYNNVGDQESSLNGMMLALEDCPVPSNLPEGSKVMIVGCENAHMTGTDWDMNDLVFMVYGNPDIPKPIEIREGDPIIKRSTVRYMIEDLGATDDFDFNDIVIDVSDVWTSTPHYVNGVLTSWTDSDHRQEAIIRHLGGTLPFRLRIGNTQLEERQGVLGADPDETFEVTGWSNSLHNVSVEVRQKVNAEVYNNVTFPKTGEAPMIIAVDPTQGWMTERSSVPETWFYIPTLE